MKRIIYLFALVAMMLGMGVSVNAQSKTWDFLSVDEADLENIQADAENTDSHWFYSSTNNRWSYKAALNVESLMANGMELAYTKGLKLKFNGQSDASKEGNFRIDIKNKRMWLASGTITIPSLTAGTKVTVQYMSSSKDVARGISVTNLTPVSGKFNENAKGTEKLTSVGTVESSGDVVLTMTTTQEGSNGMYVYSIAVEDPDDEDDEVGGDDTPTPSATDNSTYATKANNQAELVLANGVKKYYNTADVESIDIDGTTIKVQLKSGKTDTFEGTIENVAIIKASDTGNKGTIVNEAGKVNLTEARGWFESAYVKFDLFDGAKSYHVYVKGGKYNEYTKIDKELVRHYGTYGRADVVGLIKGDYSIKVVPVNDAGVEMEDAANEATGMSVVNYDRSGFAHKKAGDVGIGAYNNDGSLKTGANVVYVTAETAKTVSLAIASNNKGGMTTYTGIQNIIYGYQKGYETKALDIRIIGTISAANCDEFLSSSEGIQIKGKAAYSEMNITIEGIGDDATTTGFGFLIRNAASVELRNFANMLCMDDAVSIDTDNERIWVHNLDLFYGNAGSDADQAKGDGTIDMKGDSKYITVAYNHLWDNGKASLCGMKSESGPNWITYHHNWFDHSDSRHPRIRTMSVHVYNNYFDGIAKYGVGAAYKSNAFVENNYFRNCKYPMLISRQGSDVATNPKGTFSGEDGGMIKSFGNYMTGAIRYVTYQQNHTEFDAYEATTRDEQVPVSVVAKQGGRIYDNFDTDASLFYDYTPDAAEEVPGIVTGWLGAGRINHGDFQWVFDPSTEDNNANVIPGLKSALQNYKSSFRNIFE